MADRTTEPGLESRVLGGRYRIESMIGHGGMADVYVGTDQVLGRRVALKVLGQQFARDQSFVNRFRREAQAAASLNHPNVVSVFDTGSDDGTHFIVMEYVEGRTLSQMIREAPLLPDRAVEIAQSVARALAFAHRSGIIHRDVKPGNIMLTRTGDVKVMDFGIARAAAGADTLTQTATVLGTASYFSPEQAQGDAVDARSDIYSLGVVLYEMLTGRPPFAGDSPVAIAYKHVREQPVPPSRLNTDVPPDLDAVVLKSLAKNPANRYQSAEEMEADLQRFRTGLPVLATPVLPMAPTEALERPTRPTRVLPAETVEPTSQTRRWVAGTILALILAMGAVGLFFLTRALLSGPATIQVPDVAGKSLATAESMLSQKGFPYQVQLVPSNKDKGLVVDYRPQGFQPKGTTITLSVSNGPQMVTVDNVVCLTQKQAVDVLTSHNLTVATKTASSINPICTGAGLVADQSPEPFNTVQAGTKVTIYINPAAPPSPSPSSPSPSPSSPPTPPPSASPSASGSPPASPTP